MKRIGLSVCPVYLDGIRYRFSIGHAHSAERTRFDSLLKPCQMKDASPVELHRRGRHLEGAFHNLELGTKYHRSSTTGWRPGHGRAGHEAYHHAKRCAAMNCLKYRHCLPADASASNSTL
jgi:hypothetical protein